MKYRYDQSTGVIYAWVKSANAYVYIGQAIPHYRSKKQVIEDYERRLNDEEDIEYGETSEK
jgi:hypothetical protein